jgi:predicted dehydrogenase
MAIAALAAGKHVLVEKPIALNLADADRMLAAAQSASRLLMVGHVLPFFPEYRFLADACASGRYGRLLAAQFSRIISRPDWSNAIADVRRTGGPAIDLHIHDTHFIRLVAGQPKQVFAVGRVENSAVAHVSSLYCFGGDGPAIGCSSGALCQSSRPFMHGFEAYFDRATLSYQSGVQPLVCLSADGAATVVPLPDASDPVAVFADEIRAVLTGVESGQLPNELEARLARDALALCLHECQSIQNGVVINTCG